MLHMRSSERSSYAEAANFSIPEVWKTPKAFPEISKTETVDVLLSAKPPETPNIGFQAQ